MRWIIGDIHGMYRPLARLLGEIDRRDSRPTLIFCGDYVNRGPDSKAVVDALMERPGCYFCRGNHDDTFDLLLNNTCYISTNQIGGILTTFDHFMKYGLDHTLLSYGINWRDIQLVNTAPTPVALAELLSPIPDSHRRFFRSLIALYEQEEFFVAHAKWGPDEFAGVPSFEDQLRHSPRMRYELVWGRFTDAEVRRPKAWAIPGFFGHTPVTVYRKDGEILPVTGEKIVLLDTAAAINLDGRLTAWCFEEGYYVQSDREGAQVVERRPVR